MGKGKLKERSEQFRLNLRDLVKSVWTGALTAGVTALYEFTQNAAVDGETTLQTALFALVAYLLKNLLENKKGELKPDEDAE